MSYLDTNSRTTKPTSNEKFDALGRTPSLFGVFSGFVKGADDVQKNGRLQVWIPEFGTAPDEEQGWITVSYCSPFAGATNVETISKSDIESFNGTQTSYGMWMVPPDINNQVLVMFIAGDPARGIWIGSLYNQFMNNMVPGVPSDARNWQHPGKQVPVAEYNKWDTKITQPDRAYHPYEKTKFQGVGNQGLINDKARGTTTSGARRESPSNVFGVLTPGPVVDDNASPADIRRKGGSSFVMDDGTGTEHIELATKTGAKIRIDETNGFVYLINRDGTAWVQMDKDGNIDIFGAKDISMRAQRDLNIRADRNVNIEAGQNIFMKAAKDTTEGTTTFTYDVNNSPVTSTIPQWQYKGEGNGDGGNIVMQALNNWHSTTQNTAFLSVIDNNMNIGIGNALAVTTVNGGQDYSAKQGIKLATEASFDLAANSEIRVAAGGILSMSGNSGVRVCGSSIGLSGTTTGTNIIATSLGGGSPPLPNPPILPGPASLAEVKPLNSKMNILATWADPSTKFKRNSESLNTTVSRFITYEPCPEHSGFSAAQTSGYTVQLTQTDTTYEGSAGAGNTPTTIPAASTATGADNASVAGDPPQADNVSKDVNLAALRCQLLIHEGYRNRVYADGAGLSCGIGHFLRANEITLYPLGSPISDEQINTWYEQDSLTAIKIAQVFLGDTWNEISDVRKRAICDLAYNLGQPRLNKFVNFQKSMKAQNFNQAALDLKDSLWYKQVGRRGPNITTMISQNIDPNKCNQKFPG